MRNRVFRGIARGRRRTILDHLLLVPLVMAVSACSDPPSWERYLGGELDRLSSIQASRVGQVDAFLEYQIVTAEQLAASPHFVARFLELRKFAHAPGTPMMRAMEREMDELFAYVLPGFYDLILVDEEGEVFFTVKQEKDLGLNISDEPLRETRLAAVLRQRPGNTRFVGFESYFASDEPGAFIVTPVKSGDSQPVIGYLVMQVPANPLIQILTEDVHAIGENGEIYLVDEQRRLVTPSRFIGEPHTLLRKADTEAVRSALAGFSGGRLLDDYRGIPVLSRFMPYQPPRSSERWAVIAEVDEDELMARYYRANEERLFNALVRALDASPEKKPVSATIPSDGVRVDINEYQRSTSRVLYTVGVATCTAVSMHVPGDIAYLGHISPTDLLYDSNAPDSSTTVTRLDILRDMLRHMQWFDLRPADRQRVSIAIYATHTESLRQAIRVFLDAGYGLSQIHVLYQKDYRSINVLVGPDGQEYSDWITSKGGAWRIDTHNVPSLHAIMENAVGEYSEKQDESRG